VQLGEPISKKAGNGIYDDKGGYTQSSVTQVNFVVGAVAMNSLVQTEGGIAFLAIVVNSAIQPIHKKAYTVVRRADLCWCRLCFVLLTCSLFSSEACREFFLAS
jgi:hypothetical protein